jgi:hypothetical protein
MYFESANSTQITTGATATLLGIDGSKPRTFTVWAYCTTFTDGKLFNIGDSSGSSTYCQLRSLAPGPNTWKMSYNSLSATFTVSGSLDTWVNFIVTFDGSSTTIVYANGTQVATVSGTPSIPATTTMQLGWGSVGTATYFDGAIADLRVYNRVLAAWEISSVANSNGHDRIVSGLQARWFIQPLTAIFVAGGYGPLAGSLPATSAPATTNRLLVVVAANEQATQNNNITALSWGGQALTLARRNELWDSTAVVSSHIEVWYLKEANIAAASSNTFSITWSTTPSDAIYTVGWLTNVINQTTPLIASAVNGIIGSSSDNPISAGPLSLYLGCYVAGISHSGDVATGFSVLSGYTGPVWTNGGSSAVCISYKVGSTGMPSSETPTHTFSGAAGTPSRQSMISYAFDNSTSTMLDASGNGYTGTVVSGKNPNMMTIPFTYVWD